VRFNANDINTNKINLKSDTEKRKSEENRPHIFPSPSQAWREIFVDFQHQNREYYLDRGFSMQQLLG